jgi:hypothetical protein
MLTIPKNRKVATSRLIAMESEEMRALSTALSKAPGTASVRSLSRQLNVEIEPPLLQLLSLLGEIREESGLSSEEFASELLVAARADQMKPADGDWDRLKNDLILLFDSAESLALIGKAKHLLSDHEHTYCPHSSRVISDVRCVFRSADVEKPVGAVIVHMLKLAFHQESSDTQAFFIALDSEDLRHLRDLLDRAIAKETSLTTLIKSAQLPVMGTEVE